MLTKVWEIEFNRGRNNWAAVSPVFGFTIGSSDSECLAIPQDNLNIEKRCRFNNTDDVGRLTQRYVLTPLKGLSTIASPTNIVFYSIRNRRTVQLFTKSSTGGVV